LKKEEEKTEATKEEEPKHEDTAKSGEEEKKPKRERRQRGPKNLVEETPAEHKEENQAVEEAKPVTPQHTDISAPVEVKQQRGRGIRDKKSSHERRPVKKQQVDDGFTQVEERKHTVRKQPPREAKKPRTGPKKEEI
jgi:hypothetical protein